MKRSNNIEMREIERRRSIASEYYRQHGRPAPDTLADHQLYILGNMALEEYYDYLMFKGLCEVKEEGSKNSSL